MSRRSEGRTKESLPVDDYPAHTLTTPPPSIHSYIHSFLFHIHSFIFILILYSFLYYTHSCIHSFIFQNYYAKTITLPTPLRHIFSQDARERVALSEFFFAFQFPPIIIMAMDEKITFIKLKNLVDNSNVKMSILLIFCLIL